MIDNKVDVNWCTIIVSYEDKTAYIDLTEDNKYWVTLEDGSLDNTFILFDSFDEALEFAKRKASE